MAEADDDAKLQQLYADFRVATEKPIEAAQAAPKPLTGPALKRYLEGDPGVMDIVRRIKKSKRPEGPKRRPAHFPQKPAQQASHPAPPVQSESC